MEDVWSPKMCFFFFALSHKSSQILLQKKSKSKKRHSALHRITNFDHKGANNKRSSPSEFMTNTVSGFGRAELVANVGRLSICWIHPNFLWVYCLHQWRPFDRSILVARRLSAPSSRRLLALQPGLAIQRQILTLTQIGVEKASRCPKETSQTSFAALLPLLSSICTLDRFQIHNTVRGGSPLLNPRMLFFIFLQCTQHFLNLLYTLVRGFSFCSCCISLW